MHQAAGCAGGSEKSPGGRARRLESRKKEGKSGEHDGEKEERGNKSVCVYVHTFMYKLMYVPVTMDSL